MRDKDIVPLTAREQAYFGPRANKVPGSVDWCWQTILLLKRRWEQKTIDEAAFDALTKELDACQAWAVVPPDQPYGSLDALLKAEIGHTEDECRVKLETLAHPKEGPRNKLAKFASYTQQERAQQNGVSHYTQKKLDYLAGNAEDLLAAVQAGTLSAHRAYQLAKGKPLETPLATLHRAWRKVSPEDRRRFLTEILTSAERDMLRQSLATEETLHHV